MRSLCITSGKGGVGKTTLAINLGIAIARRGQRVLLIDGDLGMANLNVQLGVNPRFTIQDVVRGRKALNQVILSTEYELDLLPGGSGIAELADLGESERHHVMRGLEDLHGYDILIIDTAAGISNNVIRFILAAEHVILVATPEPSSLTDAYGITKVVLAKQRKALKLLVNRVASAAEAGSVVKRLNTAAERFMSYEFDFIGYVPLDPLIQESIMKQKPHLILHPRAASARQIDEMAIQLTGGAGKDTKGGLGGFLRRLLGH